MIEKLEKDWALASLKGGVKQGAADHEIQEAMRLYMTDKINQLVEASNRQEEAIKHLAKVSDLASEAIAGKEAMLTEAVINKILTPNNRQE